MCMDTNNSCINIPYTRKTCCVPGHCVFFFSVHLVNGFGCSMHLHRNFIYLLKIFFQHITDVLCSVRLWTIPFGFFASSLFSLLRLLLLLLLLLAVCVLVFFFALLLLLLLICVLQLFCCCSFAVFFLLVAHLFRVALFIVCLFLLIYSWKEHISLDAKYSSKQYIDCTSSVC